MRKFPIIIDQFRTNRGGYSKFLYIYCSKCGEALYLYQKDGPGPLKRLYYDRIHAPEEASQPETLGTVISCSHCHYRLGISDIYELEDRKAITLFAYTTINKPGKKEFPPKEKKVKPL